MQNSGKFPRERIKNPTKINKISFFYILLKKK